jgi:hypothetical protein
MKARPATIIAASSAPVKARELLVAEEVTGTVVAVVVAGLVATIVVAELVMGIVGGGYPPCAPASAVGTTSSAAIAKSAATNTPFLIVDPLNSRIPLHSIFRTCWPFATIHRHPVVPRP